MFDFKLPKGYYEPTEKKLWCLVCTECNETIETTDNQDDLINIEYCPECDSDKLIISQEYFEC